MSSIGKLLQSLSGVAQMGIVVGKLRGRANDDNLETIDRDSLLNSSIKHWVLTSWVTSYEDKQIGFIDTSDSRVHEVLSSEIGIEVWGVAPDV